MIRYRYASGFCRVFIFEMRPSCTIKIPTIIFKYFFHFLERHSHHHLTLIIIAHNTYYVNTYYNVFVKKPPCSAPTEQDGKPTTQRCYGTLSSKNIVPHRAEKSKPFIGSDFCTLFRSVKTKIRSVKTKKRNFGLKIDVNSTIFDVLRTKFGF